MRHTKDSDGNLLKRQRQTSETRNDQSPLPDLPNGQGSTAQEQMLLVCRKFQVFIAHDDGYLKVKRESDSQDVHLTWIWTLGKWSRHYVYVRVAYWDVAYGLELLEGKVDQVAMGLRHPTPDRYVK